MAISINWVSGRISVQKTDLIVVSADPEIYEHDVNDFRLILRGLEDDPDGRPWPKTHNHNTEYTIAGVTYSRAVEILDPYYVEYEEGHYIVNLIGANNNVFVKRAFNSVSVNPSNAAGLVTVQVPSNIDPVQFAKDGKILTVPYYMGTK